MAMTYSFGSDKRQRGFFREEIHYQWMMYGVGFAIAFSLIYLMPNSFATSPSAISFVNDVAKIVPALEVMRKRVPAFTPFWGLYYAVMLSTMPFCFALGYVGTFFLDTRAYKRLIIDTTSVGLTFSALLFLVGEILFLTLPVGRLWVVAPGQSATLGQMFCTWLIFGGAFANGRFIGAVWVRRKRKNTNEAIAKRRE